MIPSAIRAQVAFVAIRAYAAYSHLYYRKNISLISDGEYDNLCRWLVENYAWVKKHDINGYLRLDALKCGTGYDLKICGQTLDYALALAAKEPVLPPDLEALIG